MSKTLVTLDPSEILYYHVSFKARDPAKEENLVYIASEWIYNKEGFVDLILKLKDECSHFPLKSGRTTTYFYKTSMEHIKSLLHEHIMSG